MAQVFMDGFDKYGGLNNSSGGVGQLMAGDWTTVGNAVAIVDGLSNTGYALDVGNAGTTTRTLGANYSRLIGGVRFNLSLGGGASLAVFFDGATAQCTLIVSSGGVVQLRNGGGTGTILNSGGVVAANSTHQLSWDIAFGNAAAYQVWLDGVSLFSGTGDTTTTANAFASAFGFQGGTGGYTIDDLYLFDTSGTVNNAVLLTSPRVETTFATSDSVVQFAAGAAILGDSATSGSTLAQPLGNSLILRKYVSTVPATLNSIGIIPNTTHGSINYRPVIYADSGGVPGTLMSAGPTITGTVAGVTLTMPLTTPQSLVAGTQYWLGFMVDLTAVNLQVSNTNLLGYRAAVTFASGAPATAPAMSSNQPSYVIWGDLSGVSGNNWYMVSRQPPPGLPSYVFDATINHEDLYNFTPLSTPPPAIIHAVAVKGYWQKSDTGTKTVSMRTKSGATDSGGSLPGQAPGTSFGWLASHFETDPNTGVAWTPAALNAALTGVRVDS